MPLNTITYSDFNIEFIPSPVTGDLVKVTGQSSVVQSVMDLVQLNHYEKPFHFEIGGNVLKLLFEPNDNITAGLLAKEITDVITNFEPRATVLGVYVTSNVEDDGYNIDVLFSIQTFTQAITLSTFLKRLR
jgi:phage baseplate assembly protein W